MDTRINIIMKESFVGTGGGTYDIDDESIITALRNAGIYSVKDKDMNYIRGAIFNCTDNKSKEILINLMNRYDYGGDCTIYINGNKTDLSIYKIVDLLSMFTIKEGKIYYCEPDRLQYLSIEDIQDILLLMKYFESNKAKLLDFYHEDEYI